MNQQHRPGLTARLEGGLHGLEQAAATEGLKLQVGSLQPQQLADRDGLDRPGNHRTVKGVVKDHIEVVALPRQHGIGNQQADLEVGVTAAQDRIGFDHVLAVEAIAAGSQHQLLGGFKAEFVGPLLTATGNGDERGGPSVLEGDPGAHLPTGIGKLSAQEVAALQHQRGIQAITGLEQGRDLRGGAVVQGLLQGLQAGRRPKGSPHGQTRQSEGGSQEGAQLHGSSTGRCP